MKQYPVKLMEVRTLQLLKTICIVKDYLAVLTTIIMAVGTITYPVRCMYIPSTIKIAELNSIKTATA